ncbi:NADP-dependent oxidoreductase [Litorimonas haliclonae]|uniref:NADP-dependent oxidoreductase n=1 Tax=Litorimonas haliclonae TaxID=2081977 RepID=UPI0039EE3F8B
MINRQWTVAEHPENELHASHFGYKEIELDSPKDGEVLLKTHYLNLAPVMRMYMMKDGGGRSPEQPLNIGDVIHGRGVAEIIESRHPDYQTGDFVHGQIGWQTHKVSTLNSAEKFVKMAPRGVPAYYGLSALGMTGYSAYCGFISRGEPKAGEAVLVSGAAGGVGSLVVQMAKALGCSPVIGIAGGPEKCALVTSLGADDVIDYKSEDVASRLSGLFPNGLDIYFDNVGGEILDASLTNLAKGARVVMCGAISEYTRKTPFALKNHGLLRRENADMRGFFVYNHAHEFDQAEEAIADWIKSGQLRALVDIEDGFEHMPAALMGLYSGKNKGKRLVRVTPGEDLIY